MQDWQRKCLRRLETRVSSCTALSTWRGWEAAPVKLGLKVSRWIGEPRHEHADSKETVMHARGKNRKEEPLSPLWHQFNEARKGSLSLFHAAGSKTQGDRKNFSSAVAELGNDKQLLHPLTPHTHSTRCGTSIVPLPRTGSRVLRSTGEEKHEWPQARSPVWET